MKPNLFLLTFSVVLTASSLYSQVAAGLGGITGVVTDASGSIAPQAEVLVDNERLSIHRKVTTGNSGVFNVPALVPSAGYQITVNATGFSKFENHDVAVLVGQDVPIRATRQVQTSTVTVEVLLTPTVVPDGTLGLLSFRGVAGAPPTC